MPTWESDPLVLKLRAGTISDPFVNLTESFIIPSGCKILLSELPDRINKLTIPGFSETSSTTPEIDTFLEIDRDVNAAINILRAGTAPGGATAVAGR